MINKYIDSLLEYGIRSSLLKERDKIFSRNRILEVLKLDEYEYEGVFENAELPFILEGLISFAKEKGIIEDGISASDLFDTRLMGCLMPLPSTVSEKFSELYKLSPKAATDYYFKLCCDSNYIRKDRIKKDIRWTVNTEYGEIFLSINLSKPEKDPKAIAAAKLQKQSGYPKCMLCAENEGYAGRIDFPARQNHRPVPVTVNGKPWMLQYSPYVYYNEHCIVFNCEHTPMVINRDAFLKLLDFVKQFPHYFVGSNADLPIVGGSILTHDHFQGGNFEFPMAKSEIETPLSFKGFEDIEAGIVKWPMSVIRLACESTHRLAELAEIILNKWRNYTDEDAFVFAETDGVPHNTITPIARQKNGKFELDLVLRNNITTEKHPLGVYHPHSELHHIKKENIGLIEVMGLAVLPSRLKNEMLLLKEYILSGRDISENEEIRKHADWYNEFKSNYEEINEDNIDEIIYSEIGKVFTKVLEHAGVYKRNESGKKAFLRFINAI